MDDNGFNEPCSTPIDVEGISTKDTPMPTDAIGILNEIKLKYANNVVIGHFNIIPFQINLML